jgi:tetratricopeptide (TPR) repeat protein
MRRSIAVLVVAGTMTSVTVSNAEDFPALFDRSRAAFSRGDLVEAERSSRLAMAAAEATGKPADVAEALGGHCGISLARAQYGQAQAFCLQALGLLRVHGPRRSIPVVLNNLGGLATEQGDYKEAERYLKEALSVAGQLASGDPYAARILNNLGVLYYRMNRVTEAKAELMKAVALVERQLGRDHPWLPSILGNLGGTYLVQRKWDDAAAVFHRALQVLQQTGLPGALERAGILQNIGFIHYERGNFLQAAEVYRQAYSLRLKQLGQQPQAAHSAVSLATALAAAGELEEAERIYREAVAIYRSAGRERSMEMAAALEHLRRLMLQTNRTAAAAEIEEQVQSIRFELENTVRVGQLR